MTPIVKTLPARTARDIMSQSGVVIPQQMSLWTAAHVLCRAVIDSAPVVDERGRCVGVLSAGDFVRWTKRTGGIKVAGSSWRPRTCPFWERKADDRGAELFSCSMPAGTCVFQEKGRLIDGREVIPCSQPYSVPTDSQVVQSEEFVEDDVCHWMTRNAVTASPEASVAALAQMMLEDHVDCIIILDRLRCPIGMVRSAVILAALTNGAAQYWTVSGSEYGSWDDHI